MWEKIRLKNLWFLEQILFIAFFSIILSFCVESLLLIIFRFKSAQANGDYRDYYIWKKVSDVQGDRNYVATDGEQYAYLAYEGKDPVLNWANPAVRDHIFEAAKNFLNMGVDGFHVAYVNQILKHQPSLQVKQLSPSGSTI